MRPIFQRARQPAEKEQRRVHLLVTARNLLAGGTPLRVLSLNELARQAGMAKANVYTYFESREALLLALLWDEWERWFERLRGEARSNSRSTHPQTLNEIVATLVRLLAGAPLLCELTAALPTVLEQNLSEEAIRTFKREALVLFSDIANHLAERSPAMPASAYAELMHDAAHAIMGLYPATHPAPAAARALAAPELRFFRRTFEEELARFLGALAAEHVRRLGPRSSRAVVHRPVAPPNPGRRRAQATRPAPGGAPARDADVVTAYIDAADEPVRSRLRALRKAIRAAAPEALERVAYGLPTWHQGENLIHIGAFANHIGVYPGPDAIAAFSNELAPHKTSKGAIQFRHDAPLPKDLVARITRWRVEQATKRARRSSPQRSSRRSSAKR